MSNKLMLISNKLHSFRNFLPRLFHLRNIVHGINLIKKMHKTNIFVLFSRLFHLRNIVHRL